MPSPKRSACMGIVIALIVVPILYDFTFRSNAILRAFTFTAAKEAAVLETALRHNLRNADRDTTIFISVGSTEAGWKDPSPELLQRFNDLSDKFKPVSMARMPGPGEMESSQRFSGVKDPATGKRSWIYWAEIKEWVSNTKVRVNVGVWSGPLAGGSNTAIFELRDGQWIFTDSEDWIVH